jgi:hypothetical protein
MFVAVLYKVAKLPWLGWRRSTPGTVYEVAGMAGVFGPGGSIYFSQRARDDQVKDF